MTFSATITSKGQITIPRAARAVLNSSTVELEIQGETIILRPIRSVAGSLAKYAKPGAVESINEIRAKVWQEVADEKAARLP